MEKIKILGLRKTDNHSLYILEKSKEFFPFLRDFLIDLGFEDDIILQTLVFDADKYGNPLLDEWRNAEDEKEYHNNIENDEYKIDIIITENKVFLILFSLENKMEQISNAINKHCYMAEK